MALAVSPATVSFPLAVTEAIVLSVGLVVLLVVNFLLLRRAMRPLERLTQLMRRVDPLRPGAGCGSTMAAPASRVGGGLQ